MLARQAHAAKHPRFEPTDLEIEKPGTSEIDLQFGGVRGSDRWRAVAPDFELDLGLLDTLELDLDGAYAVQGTTSVPDNLWPSLRVALGDWHNRASDRWFALGAQAGPKLPVARGASGVGFEGLALIGFKSDPLRAIVNVGGHWAAIGEIGGIYFTSADSHQLAVTAGAQWSASEQLDFSLVALVGLASGSDPYGVLFGVSPKLAVW